MGTSPPTQHGLVLVLLLVMVAPISVEQKNNLRAANGNVKDEFSSVAREQILAHPKVREASFLFPE